MTDSKPRKTLTLQKNPSQPAQDATDTPRKRTGGRARHVAQIERVREQQRNQRDLQAEQNAPHDAASDDAQPANRNVARAASSRAAPTGRSQPRATSSRPTAAGRSANDQRDHHEPRHTAATDTITSDSRVRRAREPQHAEIFHIFAPCPQGLEEALATEMQALGFEDATPGRAGCHFHTDWTGVLRANLYSRLAARILVQVSHGAIRDENDILELAYQTPWERWFGAEQTLRVDTSAIRSPMQSLQYCNLRAKDGICDRLRDLEGARPDINTVRPDARVHLFLNEDSATLYLDTSGESLFKRGWRLDKGSAPLRENLAAGLLALSGWDPAEALMDPFCGSGTILIEGAWIALGVPPGISRPFGFERLRDHQARHWKDLKEEAYSHIATHLDSPIVGYDIDPLAIEAAERNMERAGLAPDAIRFEVGDARFAPPPADKGWLVTNPPYGERLPTEDDTGLWRAWSQNLKQNFSGWQINIISNDMDLPQQLRLKPLRRHPLYNGDLDCRLFSFEMVAASYRN